MPQTLTQPLDRLTSLVPGVLPFHHKDVPVVVKAFSLPDCTKATVPALGLLLCKGL